MTKSLNIPDVTETIENLNYVFVADEAFALGENLLKPFPQKDLTRERRIFNYRLSRARRIVENVFGILAARFRIFHTEISVSPQKIDKIILACCALHNFLRRESRTYTTSTSFDRENLETGYFEEGDWRKEASRMDNLQVGHCRNSTTNAKENRNNDMDYFNNSGAVPWHSFIIGINIGNRRALLFLIATNRNTTDLAHSVPVLLFPFPNVLLPFFIFSSERRPNRRYFLPNPTKFSNQTDILANPVVLCWRANYTGQHAASPTGLADRVRL